MFLGQAEGLVTDSINIVHISQSQDTTGMELHLQKILKFENRVMKPPV